MIKDFYKIRIFTNVNTMSTYICKKDDYNRGVIDEKVYK